MIEIVYVPKKNLNVSPPAKRRRLHEICGPLLALGFAGMVVVCMAICGYYKGVKMETVVKIDGKQSCRENNTTY